MINNKAMTTAKEVYNKLLNIFNSKEETKDYTKLSNECLELIKNYVTVQAKKGKSKIVVLDIKLFKNDKSYTMYNTIFSNGDLMRFIEDLTMATYRLNNGVGYTTPNLIEALNITRDNFKKMENSVIEIKNLDTVLASEHTTYVYNGYSFIVWRAKNDINGNPIYRILLSKDGENLTSELKGNPAIHRAYIKRNFATIQSYSLSDSLESMFQNLKDYIKQICREVKELLRSKDNININIKTIEAIAEIMTTADNPIDINSLYLNCIIDGIDELKKYDKEITSKSK